MKESPTLYYQELDFVLQGKEYAKRIARSEENSRRMLLILRTRNTNCTVTIFFFLGYIVYKASQNLQVGDKVQ